MQLNNKDIILKNKKLAVGIDIGKNTHYTTLMDCNRKILKKGFKIENSRDGFEQLSLQLSYWKEKEIIIGMEPTGHYFKPLKNYLEKKKYKVVLINPMHVNRTKEIYDNFNNKNDIKDSILICNLLWERKFLHALDLKGLYADLRRLTTHRQKLVIKLGREKIFLRNLLDQYLPEYQKRFSCLTCKTSLALLKKYGIAELRNSAHEIAKINLIVKISHHSIKKQKAIVTVKELSSSIGIDEGIEGAELELRLIIKQIEELVNDLQEVEEKMQSFLMQTEEAPFILSIKGIGIVTAGSFLGEIGSLKKFKNPQQILKISGLLLRQNASGKYRGKDTISKRGRKLLRHILQRMLISLISNNKEFKLWYRYKVDVLKKPKMVALTSLISKAIKIIFGLCKNKKFYNGTYVLKTLPNLSYGQEF